MLPCKDCHERHTACHDTCERYIKAKAQMQKAKQKEKQERENLRMPGSFSGAESRIRGKRERRYGELG